MGASYFVIEITTRVPGDIPLMDIIYKYNSRNFLVSIATYRDGSTEAGDPNLLLYGPAPRGSGVGTGNKKKYPAGILYPPVAKYLASNPDIAKRKRLSYGLLKRLREGLPMPGRYVGTRI